MKGFFNFVIYKPSLNLVSDVPDSNRNWKSRYFFVQGLNWVCRPDEWDSIGEEYDNIWGILDEANESSIVVRSVVAYAGLGPSMSISCLLIFHSFLF